MKASWLDYKLSSLGMSTSAIFILYESITSCPRADATTSI